MRLSLLFLFAGILNARVLLVSLDGLGWDAFTHDPAAAELTALRALARRGVEAEGVRPHFPSTTSNSHAALFTGAWGDVNGIIANSMPAARGTNHTAFERVNGYRSDGLRAEPLWVAAGRQGVPTVALQVTQAYPFSLQSVGANLPVAPVVANGYQTRLIAPGAVIRAGDVRAEPCPAAAPGDRCFQWNAGPVKLHGRLQRRRGAYRSIAVSAEGGDAAVVAEVAPTETEQAGARDLARRFSDGLYLAQVPESSAAVLYFRLFECAGDGSAFLLYQSPIHEFGIHYGSADGRALAARLLREAGGFIGNGPESAITHGPFQLGTPLWKGGSGAAERRYLEVCELVTRQAIRHARWLLDRYQPELFIGYLNFPDETEHAWKGAAAVHPGYAVLRRWGYAIVNSYAKFYVSAARPEDHLIFVSDHGMTAIAADVAVNAALREADLLDVDRDGKPDPARTRAVELRNCILLNTTEWQGGIVAPSQRPAAIAAVERVLRQIRDPATGESLIARIYDSPEDAARFGYGGPNGADFCFDYRPGYAGIAATDPPLVRPRALPGGEHGFDPTRADMQAILIGAGPRLPAGTKWSGVRSIDVAPLIADLLGIAPPRDARGRSPLR